MKKRRIIDQTDQQLVLQAVQSLVARVEAGDLWAELQYKVVGTYRPLADGINRMLDALTRPLKWLQSLRIGFPKASSGYALAEEYNGDFNTIKNNLNSIIDEIHILVDEMGVLIRLAREGNLAKRADPDRTKGVYRKILRGATMPWMP